jgi:hypothetical protein
MAMSVAAAVVSAAEVAAIATEASVTGVGDGR